jgi:hypothetical protein
MSLHAPSRAAGSSEKIATLRILSNWKTYEFRNLRFGTARFHIIVGIVLRIGRRFGSTSSSSEPAACLRRFEMRGIVDNEGRREGYEFCCWAIRENVEALFT